MGSSSPASSAPAAAAEINRFSRSRRTGRSAAASVMKSSVNSRIISISTLRYNRPPPKQKFTLPSHNLPGEKVVQNRQ